MDESEGPLDTNLVVEGLKKLYRTDMVRRISNDPVYMIEIPPGDPLVDLSAGMTDGLTDVIKSNITPPPFDPILKFIHKKTAAFEENQAFFIDPVRTIPANQVDDRFWGQEQIGLEMIKPILRRLEVPRIAIGVVTIDTGTSADHPALTEIIWKAPERFTVLVQNKPYDFPAGSYGLDTFNFEAIDKRGRPIDDHHHGTLVSGVIGGKTFGVARASDSFPVQLLSVKAFDHQYSFDSRPMADTVRIIQALDFIKEAKRVLIRLNNPIDLRVVNMSFVFRRREAPYFSLELETKIKELANDGILFVSAAGNEGRNLDLPEGGLDPELLPAGFDGEEIISVGATARNGGLWEGSNYGEANVHIAAPGDGIYSTTLDGKFDFAWGTSLAAPFVAASAALLLSAQPGLKTLEAKGKLLEFANRNPSLKVKSQGKLDLRNSLFQ